MGRQTKRLFDVVFALCLLLLTLPLFIIVTVVLKVTDPGPVIYRHVRIGLRVSPVFCDIADTGITLLKYRPTDV